MSQTIEKKVYLFELDDVLYPAKEYILQVYYLFSNFVEYTEGKSISKSILKELKQYYLEKGEEGAIEFVLKKFDLAEEYKENYERLLVNAQLPLKLELFTSAILKVGDLISQSKIVGILTKGNPVMQLNKIRQIEWKGLDKYLKVYFLDELHFRELKPYLYIAEELNVLPNEIEHVNEPFIS